MCVYVLIRLYIRTLWSNRDGFCHQNARLAFYSKAPRVIEEDCKTCLISVAITVQPTRKISWEVEKPVFPWWLIRCFLSFPCLQKWPHLEAHPYRKRSRDFPTLKKHLSWLSRNGTCCRCKKQQTWLVNSSKYVQICSHVVPEVPEHCRLCSYQRPESREFKMTLQPKWCSLTKTTYMMYINYIIYDICTYIYGYKTSMQRDFTNLQCTPLYIVQTKNCAFWIL